MLVIEMRFFLFIFSVAVLFSGYSHAGQFIRKEGLNCILENAETYEQNSTSAIIIIVNQCPKLGHLSDLLKNQLPPTVGIKKTTSEEPNVLVFSKPDFRCLIAHWRNKQLVEYRIEIPAMPCEDYRKK